MRRLAIIALALLIASPAGAQSKKIVVIKAPTAAEAGLRGAAVPAEEVPAAPALDFSISNSSSSLPPSLAFTRPLASTASAGAGTRTPAQCRAACAQSHYFCLAAEDEQTCNPQWSRCVSGCS